jgi:hypothetical protein
MLPVSVDCVLLPLWFSLYVASFCGLSVISLWFSLKKQRGNHRQSTETGNIEKKPKGQSQTIHRNWQHREKTKGAITDNPQKLAT